jgi:hypothetical protein
MDDDAQILAEIRRRMAERGEPGDEYTDDELRAALGITLAALARDTRRVAVDVHMRFESDADREAVVGWLRKNTLHEVVEPEGGDPILRLDEAQDENAATIRANVLIKAAYPETGVPLERVLLKPGGWGPQG